MVEQLYLFFNTSTLGSYSRGKKYIAILARTNFISLKTYTNNSTHFSYISHKGETHPKVGRRLAECSMQMTRCTYKVIEVYRGRPHQIMHPYIPPNNPTGKAALTHLRQIMKTTTPHQEKGNKNIFCCLFHVCRLVHVNQRTKNRARGSSIKSLFKQG